MSITVNRIGLDLVKPLASILERPQSHQGPMIRNAIASIEKLPQGTALSQRAVVMMKGDELQGLAVYQLQGQELFLLGIITDQDTDTERAIMDGLCLFAKNTEKKTMIAQTLHDKKLIQGYKSLGFQYNPMKMRCERAL